MKTLFLLLLLPITVLAAKDCNLDQTRGLPQNNPGVGMTARAGETVAAMGESNTRQIFAHVRGDLSLVNSATGGCTIGAYARGSSKCWGPMPTNADIVWMKPINRSKGIDLNVYNAGLDADIRGALQQIANRMPNVREVWVSGHHASPWAVANNRGAPPKQGEPYSWSSGIVAESVVNNPPAVPFSVVNGPSLWRPGTFWTCNLFKDDGVHLTDAGNKLAGDMLTDAIAVALGQGPGDPPPPEPQQCNDVPRWATFCEWSDRQQRCVCRK